MSHLTINKDLNNLLGKKQRAVIITHKHPDGDAVGSALGFMLWLQQSGIQCISVINSDPIPRTLQWLPGTSQWVSLSDNGTKSVEDILALSDLIFYLDFNASYRMGRELQNLVSLHLQQKKNCAVVIIDHHPDPEEGNDLTISEPFRSATAEVLCGLVGLPDTRISSITPEIATCWLAAICTDTGLFAHNASRGELYTIVGQLIECGGDKEAIVQNIFHNDKIERQQLLGYILNKKIEYFPHLKTALFMLSLEELSQFDMQESDMDGLVNFPLSAKTIEIAAFIRENETDGIKISLRSEKDWPVNIVAKEGFGGGGHKNAAGAEFSGTLLEARSILLQQIENLFNK